MTPLAWPAGQAHWPTRSAKDELPANVFALGAARVTTRSLHTSLGSARHEMAVSRHPYETTPTCTHRPASLLCQPSHDLRDKLSDRVEPECAPEELAASLIPLVVLHLL